MLIPFTARPYIHLPDIFFKCKPFENNLFHYSFDKIGIQGDHGPSGEEGVPGFDGEAGIDGSRGMKGSRGEAGRGILMGEWGEQGK